MSVKIPFTEEDKHAIKILREEKQYSHALSICRFID